MNSQSNNSQDLYPGEKNGYQPLPVGFMTKSIHAGQDPEQWHSKSVVAPITMSSTFKQTGPAEYEKYEYGRSGNPTRNVLEECLSTIDGGKYGLAYASGLGAATTILALLGAGDHVVAGNDIYGGTNRLLNQVLKQFDLEASYIDTTDIKKFEKAIKPNTKMAWIETPTNPTLKVSDLKAISDVCKKHKIIYVMDNSFLSPYFLRPLEFGADMVMHSISKYLNGHSDVIMGAVVTNDEEIHKKLRFLQTAMGIVPSPFDCYQVLRGMKTLGLRMRQHHQNGIAVAKYLETHPKIIKVIHPGLPSHPQHKLFKKQCSGHSGMLAIYIKGGMEEAKTFLKALKLFALGSSLGGIESLISLPRVMSHADVPDDILEELEITDNFIRVSVGLEDVEDIIADLEQALETI